MADFNSSLPIRTQSNGDVVVELADGTTPSQKLAINASGSAQVTGDGTAGTPDPGVVTIQGITGGTAVPISGTVTASNPSVSATGAAPPADATYVGALASTSAPTLINGDMEPFSLTLAGALRVDGSATTQPVSGTVTANQGGAPWSQNLTEVGGSSIALGQTTTSASIPVTMASNQPNINVAVNAALPAGANTIGAVTQASGPWTQNLTEIGGSAYALGQAAMAASAPVVIASNQSAVASNITQLGGSSPSASNSLPVEITTGSAFVSGSNPLPVEIVNPAAEGTFKNYYTDSSSVASGTTSTQSTTVGGTTGFYLQSLLVAGSGKFKAQIQIETASGSGIFNVFWTVFNSTATPNQQIAIPNQTLVPTGARIQVLMTNNDLAAQDLYSTVMGYQV